jgi:hypothetical protein
VRWIPRPWPKRFRPAPRHRFLADFLVTIGYLEKHGEQFANTASTQRWFTRAGQVDYTPGLSWTSKPGR